MTLIELLDRVWRDQNRQMAWGRIPDRRISSEPIAQPFTPNDDYVVVRIASMFLRDSRRLWLKLSPLAHATVGLNGRVGPRTETAVIGPAQFGELASAPADRSVILFQRLAGPMVWRGGDLDLAVGLFAVPKDKAAVALLDTLAQLSGLGIPGLSQADEVARIVKGGVEGLMGLDGTAPVLGVRVVLRGVGEAAPCMLAGIAAPAREVDFDRLWVKEGRLMTGQSPTSLRPYEAHDHLVISVERGPAREDWRGLPKLLAHEAAFRDILTKRDLPIEERKKQLSDAFRGFDSDLEAEDELTSSDKSRVRGQVIADLQRRVDELDKPVFKRGPLGPDDFDPRWFDFLQLRSEGATPTAKGAVPF